MAEIVTPGERLALAADHDAGAGTHVSGPYVCASLVGARSTAPPPSPGGRPSVHVRRPRGAGAAPAVPAVGDAVAARVLRVTPRLAAVELLAVGGRPVPEGAPFSGVVRLQDVRAAEPDKVTIAASFRPGDIIRAEVLSLGDARSYFLTTAKNELGVVHARALGSGEPMVPAGWDTMRCPATGAHEPRKVAKVDAAAA